MAFQIVNPPGMGILAPGESTAPFKVLMAVGKGARSLFTARSKDGAYAVSPLFLKKGVAIDITGFITSMSWNAADDERFTTLNVSLDNHRGVFNQIPHGTKIRVQVRRPFYDFKGTQQGKFYDYISAYVFEKSRTADGGSQTMSLTCYDKTYWLASNDFHKVYKADSKHKGGWTASQIIRDIAAKLKLPIGTITPTKAKIKRIELKGSALDCIMRVLSKDKQLTKRKKRYSVDMRNGKLNVVLENPEPKVAYKFTEENAIESGTLTERLRQDKFATRITVSGNAKKWGRTKGGSRVKKIDALKVTVNPKERAYQQAFGIIHKHVKLKGTHSAAELRRLANNQLEAALRPEREFSISVRGVPHLWPSSRVYVLSGYFGVNGLVRVKSVQYNVEGGEFTLELGLSADKKSTMSTKDLRIYYKKRDIRY